MLLIIMKLNDKNYIIKALFDIRINKKLFINKETVKSLIK